MSGAGARSRAVLNTTTWARAARRSIPHLGGRRSLKEGGLCRDAGRHRAAGRRARRQAGPSEGRGGGGQGLHVEAWRLVQRALEAMRSELNGAKVVSKARVRTFKGPHAVCLAGTACLPPPSRTSDCLCVWTSHHHRNPLRVASDDNGVQKTRRERAAGPADLKQHLSNMCCHLSAHCRPPPAAWLDVRAHCHAESGCIPDLPNNIHCTAYSKGCRTSSHGPTGPPRTCHRLPPLLLLPPPLQVAIEIQLQLGQRTAGASVLQQALQGNNMCRTRAQGGGS